MCLGWKTWRGVVRGGSALQEPFDPSKYHDHYREALLELIASKTQGHEVVVPEGEAAAAPVTDLMAALRASIEAAQKRKGGAAQAPGQERKADGAKEEATEERKAPRAAKKPRSRKKAA